MFSWLWSKICGAFVWLWNGFVNLWGYLGSFIFWVGGCVLAVISITEKVADLVYNELNTFYSYITSLPGLPSVLGGTSDVPSPAMDFVNTVLPFHEFVAFSGGFIAVVLLCATIRMIKSFIWGWAT